MNPQKSSSLTKDDDVDVFSDYLNVQAKKGGKIHQPVMFRLVLVKFCPLSLLINHLSAGKTGTCLVEAPVQLL